MDELPIGFRVHVGGYLAREFFQKYIAMAWADGVRFGMERAAHRLSDIEEVTVTHTDGERINV
jgi:hypothetical protein